MGDLAGDLRPRARPATARPDRRSGGRGASPLLWLALAVALFPIVAAIVQHSVGGWVPEGDDAWVARRTLQVGTTDPPLLGQESSANDSPRARGLSHPGPVAYYLMAVPYAATAWSPVGLAVGAGLIVAAAAVACVVAAHDAAGERGAVAVALAMAAVSVRLGPDWLVRPNNSALVALPVLASLLGLWAYLRGRVRGLAIALLAGGFALQSSLAVLPLSVAVVSSAVGVRLVRRHRGVERSSGRSGSIVVGVLALAWAPPLVDGLVRSPGNLRELAHFLLGQAGLADRSGQALTSLGPGTALASVVAFLTGVPGLEGRDLRGPSVLLTSPDALGLLRPLLLVVTVGATVGWARRRGSAGLRALLVVVAGALVVAVAALSRRPTATRYTQTYFVVWLQAVVALAWAAVALAAVEAGSVAVVAVQRRRRGAGRRAGTPPNAALPLVLRAVLGVAVVAALAAAVVPIERGPADAIRELSAQVRSRVPVGTYAVVGVGFVPWTSTAKGLAADLLAHGYDIRAQEWGGMVDEPRRRVAPGQPRLVVTSDFPQADGIDVVARRVGPRETLTVRLLPGGPDTDLCAELGILAAHLGRANRTGEVAAAAATATGKVAALDAIDVRLLRAATDEPRLVAAIAVVEDRRPAAMARLRALPPTGPVTDEALPPALVGALDLLVGSYLDRCEARPRPGAALLAPG